MNKTLSSVVAWALLGLGFGWWLGPKVGWSIFAFGLLTMIIVSGMQLQQIRRWVRNLEAPLLLLLALGTKSLPRSIANLKPTVKSVP